MCSVHRPRSWRRGSGGDVRSSRTIATAPPTTNKTISLEAGRSRARSRRCRLRIACLGRAGSTRTRSAWAGPCPHCTGNVWGSPGCTCAATTAADAAPGQHARRGVAISGSRLLGPASWTNERTRMSIVLPRSSKLPGRIERPRRARSGAPALLGSAPPGDDCTKGRSDRRPPNYIYPYILFMIT